MASEMDVVDMEAGLPTVRESLQRLDVELTVARRKGIGVLKIVHGYGSSGKGGRLRTSLRTSLERRRQEGTVGRVVVGEAWSIFDAESRALMDRFPALRRDRDLEKSNPGITIVEVK